MRPDTGTVATWLGLLAADRLIALSPRTVIEVEALLRVLLARGIEDPAEIGHSLASLLAKDEERWRQVLDHFHRTFELPAAVPIAVGPRMESSPEAEEPPNRSPPRRAMREPAVGSMKPPRFARLGQLTRRLRGSTLAAGLAVFLAVGIFVLPRALGWVGLWWAPTPVHTARKLPPWLKSLAGRAPEPVTSSRPPLPEPVTSSRPAGPHLEMVPEATRSEPMSTPPGVPSLTQHPGPAWLRWLLAGASALLAVFGARWWLADRDFAEDAREIERRSDERRDRLMRDTSSLGVPYHIERAPPLPVGAIDDAATLLGRIARREEGLELDVLPTIDRTIEAGGRVVPVFCPDQRREALLVFVDVEEGTHPYLDGIEWILERWKRLGVPFVRYDYRERPALLLRHPDHRPIQLDDLARRTEGMPLLLVSRMTLPEDFHGRLDWLGRLSMWPNRAFIDLDPRPRGDRRIDAQRVLDRIESSRLPRYPFTREGLLACAAALSGGGQKRLATREQALARAGDEGIEDALRRWAASACCVPDPSWAHLDSLRRELPEIRAALPDARYVQRLIDWVRAHGHGDGQVGLGPCLRFHREARSELLSGLRGEDRERWPDAPEARLEHRARRLLIRQLEAADVHGDAFEREKRDMKMAMHRAVLSPEKAEQLVAEFADSAVAPELRALLAEELRLQWVTGLAGSGERWSARVREEAGALVDLVEKGRRRARLGDLVRLGRWRTRHGLAVAAVAAMAGASWGGWWVKLAREPRVVTPATWKVVGETPIVIAALADVAPMRFVKLPGGRFQMGSTPEERERFLKELSKEQRDVYEDEKRHSAEVGPFELAIHEVTQKQWAVVMNNTKPFDCDYGCGDDLPAQNVSWIDAAKFMNALTDRENKTRPANEQRTRCYKENKETWTWERGCTGYRLPTEAEWEYAARAGTETAYSFGDDVKEACTYGNGADLAAKRKHTDWTVNEACDDGFADLAPVGSFKANAWGLYDMHGNVWEWVWDWYGDYPKQAEAGYSGPESGSGRVLRGGSFSVVPWRLRSSLRVRDGPTFTSEVRGFRCARGSPPSP